MQIYIFFLILISTISVESKEIFSNYPQPVEPTATYVSATDRYMQLFGRETIDNTLRGSNVSLITHLTQKLLVLERLRLQTNSDRSSDIANAMPFVVIQAGFLPRSL